MITSISQSKLNSVIANTFRVVYVSEEAAIEEFNNLVTLLPSASSMLSYKDGQCGKKSLQKKYKKDLKAKNSPMEYPIYIIGMSIKAKDNICLVCSDEEYKIGYLKILAKYIANLYGIDFCDGKELKERLNEAMDEVCETKKERKLIKTDDEDLGGKKRKLKKDLTKSIKKSLRSEMGSDGEEAFEKFNRRYAIDQLALSIMANEIAKLKDGQFKNINTEKIESIRSYIDAIVVSADPEKSDKLVRKSIKNVCGKHGLKVKPKSLKELTKDAIVALVGEIYSEIQRGRYEKSPEKE